MPTRKSRTRMYSFKVASKGKVSPKQLKSLSSSFRRNGMPIVEVKEGNRRVFRGCDVGRRVIRKGLQRRRIKR